MARSKLLHIDIHRNNVSCNDPVAIVLIPPGDRGATYRITMVCEEEDDDRFENDHAGWDPRNDSPDENEAPLPDEARAVLPGLRPATPRTPEVDENVPPMLLPPADIAIVSPLATDIVGRDWSAAAGQSDGAASIPATPDAAPVPEHHALLASPLQLEGMETLVPEFAAQRRGTIRRRNSDDSVTLSEYEETKRKLLTVMSSPEAGAAAMDYLLDGTLESPRTWVTTSGSSTHRDSDFVQGSSSKAMGKRRGDSPAPNTYPTEVASTRQ